jgi:hypothetical protein
MLVTDIGSSTRLIRVITRTSHGGFSGRVQTVKRVYRVWVVPVRYVGGMDAVVKSTWKYLRRPLTGTAQTYRSDEWTRGYILSGLQRLIHRYSPL